MKENNYRLGLVSVSFRKHSPREILEAMKQAELTHIEWGSDVHASYNNKERLLELAELQREYGIECSSYGTYFYIGETPVEELRGDIAAAKTLGTNILRLWCGKKSGSEMTGEEREAFLSACRRVAKIAEEEGVILCMECHRKSFTDHLSDALWLMEKVNSKHFRMYWQPFQWQSVQENLAYAEAIAPFTHHIHVFQWKGEQKFSLSEGIEEWQGYLQKFDLPRTLLLEFMPDGQLSTLAEEVKALRRIIEK